MIRVALALFFTFVHAAAFAGGPERLTSFLADLRSLKSVFQQTLYDEQSNQLEDSKGTLFLQRPDRFRWDYEQPYAQEIVADGERVWMYDSELEQVTVRKLDEAVGATPALLLSSERPVEESFVVEDLGDENDLEWVGLKPRSAESDFVAIRLGFDGEALALMELTDSFGQLTKLRFSQLERNPELAPDVFAFKAPPGVDILSEQ